MQVNSAPRSSRQTAKWLNRGNVIGTAALCVAAAIVLRLMGQPWWCACGSPIPWSWDIWSSHNSQHAIDPYTFTHVLHGVLLCGALYLGRSYVAESYHFLLAITVEAGWEILENTPTVIRHYRETTISQDYTGDSITNSVFDILACALGFLIARRIGWKGSLLLVAVTELALVVTIRDSLTLNVLMLIWDNEAIKNWQS